MSQKTKSTSPRVDAATAQRRVDDLLRIRLDGAEFWDVREFVRQKEAEPDNHWTLAEDATPMSDRQLRRYIDRADAAIATSSKRGLNRLRKRHLAQRRNLYAKAVLTGDIRTALACLRDEAEMLGLYEKAKDNAQRDPAWDRLAAVLEAKLNPATGEPSTTRP
jgi:hypothetical protein